MSDEFRILAFSPTYTTAQVDQHHTQHLNILQNRRVDLDQMEALRQHDLRFQLGKRPKANLKIPYKLRRRPTRSLSKILCN